MLSRKSQINQVFVYLLSIMIILFVGFLVIQFISAFTSDASDGIDLRVYESMRADFSSVYRTFGSERIGTYRIAGGADRICFIEVFSCIQDLDFLGLDEREGLQTIFEGGDNVVIFESNEIISSQNIGTFRTEGGCICFDIENRMFRIVFENRNNIVWVKTY